MIRQRVLQDKIAKDINKPNVPEWADRKGKVDLGITKGVGVFFNDAQYCYEGSTLMVYDLGIGINHDIKSIYDVLPVHTDQYKVGDEIDVFLNGIWNRTEILVLKVIEGVLVIVVESPWANDAMVKVFDLNHFINEGRIRKVKTEEEKMEQWVSNVYDNLNIYFDEKRIVMEIYKMLKDERIEVPV